MDAVCAVSAVSIVLNRERRTVPSPDLSGRTAGLGSLNWDVFSKAGQRGKQGRNESRVHTEKRKSGFHHVSPQAHSFNRITTYISNTFSFPELTVLWVFINTPDGNLNDLM